MNGQRYYSVVRGTARFFFFDTNLMDAEQVKWIDAALRVATEDWKIAVFHHPIYSDGDRHGPNVALRVMLEPMLVKYGVDVVFSGHEHIYERIKEQKGIPYFIVGSSGQLRKGGVTPSAITAASFADDQAFLVATIDRHRDDVPGDFANRRRRGFRRAPQSPHVGEIAMVTHTHALASPARRSRHGDRHIMLRLFRGALNRFLLLPLGAVIALVWANTEPESYFRFSQALAFPVNEIAMAFFLALIAQELFEALMPGGALAAWRHRALPMVAALGGLIGSVITFLSVCPARARAGADAGVAGSGRRGHRRRLLPVATDLRAPQRTGGVPAAGRR